LSHSEFEEDSLRASPINESRLSHSFERERERPGATAPEQTPAPRWAHAPREPRGRTPPRVQRHTPWSAGAEHGAEAAPAARARALAAEHMLAAAEDARAARAQEEQRLREVPPPPPSCTDWTRLVLLPY
jgi:hypothetical protein